MHYPELGSEGLRFEMFLPHSSGAGNGTASLGRKTNKCSKLTFRRKIMSSLNRLQATIEENAGSLMSG